MIMIGHDNDLNRFEKNSKIKHGFGTDPLNGT